MRVAWRGQDFPLNSIGCSGCGSFGERAGLTDVLDDSKTCREIFE